MSGKPVAIPRDESPGRVQPSVAVPVRVTRSTQKLLDKGLELLVVKTPHTAKGNFSLPIDPIILDELSDSEKTSKGKRKMAFFKHKK
ncbi:hypothetical protein MTR67_013743 [Solanum verrucosum]|uniref:Uncharacterized protein n=1 Tax=Solanum verrucosum TaxID=315347 RepID=A0AAF0QD38_SOLVR|nr:hypothetical protein MTR67_013743 [Solanum verrucosum]